MRFKYVIAILLLTLGMYFRVDQWLLRYYYGHDADLAAWTFKDIIIDRHLRLVGQETSSQGLFIGPVFYYLLIPFYLLTSLDPIGTIAFGWVIGFLSLISVLVISLKIFGPRIGLWPFFVFAASQTIAATEREPVPTTPLFLWSAWFFYSLFELGRGKRFALPLLAVLLALAWNIQASLLILSPLIILVLLAAKTKPSLKVFFLSAVVAFITTSPFLAFEAKHDFLQTQSFLSSFSKKSQIDRTLVEKFTLVSGILFKNSNVIFWDRPQSFPLLVAPVIVLILGNVYLLPRFKILTTVLFSWLVLMFLLFVIHPINLSEYYLNSLNIPWIIWAGVGLYWLSGRFPKFVKILIVFYLVSNLWRHVAFVPNRSGYLDRKAIVSAITNDSRQHYLPCVSVSYITTPGNQLGYRYLFWLARLKLAPISNSVPVYSIVFPHRLVGRLDATFGALGLVFPDYDGYTSEAIEQACSGQDYNLTDSMFGFTK